ncbi:MAG: hypothetical protein IAA96_03295 [Spirochaetes bacterium]|uniref:Uncharacterized protein n=1 Tax=Candidatus Avitreponema avistercoris TaxID=2840705 RepID=A0A9D9EMY3_9SPIR|nr:hypothetical protein [Candidatus Avitreponema avistercoris]
MQERNLYPQDSDWIPEETCLQELYSNIFFNLHYGFIHRGHEYFITFDFDSNKNQIWVIYDRDLSDSKLKDKTDWDDEPRQDYQDIPALVFTYRLKNDERTILEYCCDIWKIPRLLFPEPVDKNQIKKIWRHS